MSKVIFVVDFEKLLGKKKVNLSIDPLVIYDNLDKESGKEYFRPAQKSILERWHKELRNHRDIIVKSHTGQGKTLIGLILLQSSINEGKGPAIYICPNSYLVSQTIEQARSFGIETVQFIEGQRFPREFLNSEAILVATCKKLFNGKSIFGVIGSRKEPVQIGSIVIDDAHKCLDIIRESFSIRVSREKKGHGKNQLYYELLNLFEESMKRQAAGTFIDIKNCNSDGIMAVPFWTWHDRQKEVLAILQNHADDDELLYVWDLLKDKIEYCTCIFSGKELEISPRLLPLDMIPSFVEAPRRIFLSATLTEDAFLVRDLDIDSESISEPLSSEEIRYSGERLILMPTLIDTNLERNLIIPWLSKFASNCGSFGVVSLVPSFYHSDYWRNCGGIQTNVKTLQNSIDGLKVDIKQNNAKKIHILVNEYDGVDLPDSVCRVLCVDSLPSCNLLIDRYAQEIRPDSKIIRRQLAQRVEQGIGRAIRGSSDWCIVLIIGNNLTNFLSENVKRAYLSQEAQMQIKIGEELASEIKSEKMGIKGIEKLINQSLNREVGWKEYYKDRMSKVEREKMNKVYLNRAMVEREAEINYQRGQIKKATDLIQNLIAMDIQGDKGWLLQLMATYLYPMDKTNSMEIQLKAHGENQRLFRPETGISYAKLKSSGTRISRILDEIKKHDTFNSLKLDVGDIMGKLAFNTPSGLFEEGIDELGRLMGFSVDRPEKKTGRGPDNLWQIGKNKYWIIECKNMVLSGRSEISKDEVAQMGVSVAWFKEHYEDLSGIVVMAHPATTLARDAYISEKLFVLNQDALDNIKKNVTSFYNSFADISFDSLTSDIIKQKLAEHSIDDIDSLLNDLHRVEVRKSRK